MKTIAVKITVAAIVAMTLHAPATLADNNLPQAQQDGNVTYVTGGIGDEERNALRAVQHDYNLHIVNAVGASGAYPGDTHIIIYDKHHQEVVNTDTDPLFYAQLPAGRYTVEESSEGEDKQQSVVIAANKPENITFRW